MLAVAFLVFLPLLVVAAVLAGLWRLLRLLRMLGVFRPLNVVFHYRHWLRGFDYREGQLMRASHGVAWSLLAALIGLHLLKIGSLGLLPLAVLAVPFVWGAVVFFGQNA